MRKVLMIFSVFAFLATSMASFAHAETLCDPSSEICASQHVNSDNAPDNDASKDGCDMACSGCHVHCHNHIASHSHDGLSALFGAKEKRILGQELIYLSDLTYGLKRPPKA
ncbi:MAG: hypothetical protein H6864_00145 [Micavibrio sp.]|nr:hypothetical protein [Micavibrio sp.]